MNNVLLVAVLHRRYDLYGGGGETRKSSAQCLPLACQTEIKDVVESAMRSAPTGKIILCEGGAKDRREVRKYRQRLFITNKGRVLLRLTTLIQTPSAFNGSLQKQTFMR